MNIACLGWGSLIWDSRGLPIRGVWFDDGPILPIEFARESKDRRITLVIVKEGTPVRSLWALMSVNSLEHAKAALAEREGIDEKNISKTIGYWTAQPEESHGEPSLKIGTWASGLKLDAVVWTNLQCGFRDKRGLMPSYEEVLDYLKGLTYEQRLIAEEYVRKAPVQVDTEFRRKLKSDFGWD